MRRSVSSIHTSIRLALATSLLSSQTAWALIGLTAGEDEISDSALRGVAWLLERQNSDGRWEDTEFTGTGFPKHFYLRYHMYAHYFPLMALGRFRRRMAERASR